MRSWLGPWTAPAGFVDAKASTGPLCGKRIKRDNVMPNRHDERKRAMTLLQLKILREIERQAFNISAAAKALNTSQPGVSRQLQTLERNLGVPLLVRQKNRIVAFSPVGRSIMEAAKTLLNQAENIEL